MKRLLIVLFGVLVIQGSVWAECLKAYPDDAHSIAKAAILHPVSEGLVLKKKAPFLLQWKDIRGQSWLSPTVNIRLYEKGDEDSDLFGRRLNNQPNNGILLITKQDFRRAKIEPNKEYFFQVENPKDKKAKISSRCFTFNVREKEDLRCNTATTVKECLNAIIDNLVRLNSEVRETSSRLRALELRWELAVSRGRLPTDDVSDALLPALKDDSVDAPKSWSSVTEAEFREALSDCHYAVQDVVQDHAESGSKTKSDVLAIFKEEMVVCMKSRLDDL